MKAKLALIGLLAMAAAIVACQREAQIENNPTYDPVSNTVNTQFVVNISTGTGDPQTKQSSVDVQASSSNFRGISDAHILTYDLNYKSQSGAYYLWKVGDESSKATKDFDIGDMVTTSDISSDDQRRILELSLPIGTNSIIVFGRATRPSNYSLDKHGRVNASGTALNSSLSNVSFTLENRLQDVSAFKQAGDLFGRMLTGIMNSGRVVETTARGYKVVDESNPTDNTYAFWWPIDATSAVWNEDEEACRNAAGTEHEGYSLHKGSIRWKDYGDIYLTNPESLVPSEKLLGEAYVEVMNLKVDGSKKELRAGAAVTICRLVKDMYGVLNKVLLAEPTTVQEYIAFLLSKEIVKRAAYFFDYDEGSQNMNFRTYNDIMSAVDLLIPDRTHSDYDKLDNSFFYYRKTSASDTREEYDGFPQNMGMPIGSAIMDFMEVGPDGEKYRVVYYPMDIPIYGMGDAAGKFSVTNYRYPAEIMYHSNSSIRTSAKVVDKNAVDGYPRQSTAWSNESYWYKQTWNGTEVSAATSSVAVAKPLNYSTALLKARFAYSEGTIEDNNGGVHTTEKNNSIDVTAEKKFKVTGIMIGGVNDEVGWDFLAKNTSFDKMIYDRLGDEAFFIPPYTTNTDKLYSDPVYTLTFDNYLPGTSDPLTKQSKVYIGLELVNNTGQDIWGELNLIRNGGTFYLVAELDPYATGAAKNLIKNDKIDLSRSDCFYPPFDENGNTINAVRVFMQDYVTDVKFKFSKESLKHAYVTMPDLRAGQISLGMSVDLKWEAGMEYEVEMGNVTGN